MRASATAASDWLPAHSLRASVAASSEDHPDVLIESPGSGIGLVPQVHFQPQAKAATIRAPFHREILAPQNEEFHSVPETLTRASVIDPHQFLSVNLRPSQRLLAEPRAYTLLKRATDHRSQPRTSLRRRVLDPILSG